MPYGYAKERNRARFDDEDRDPSCALDLAEVQRYPRKAGKSLQLEALGPGWILATFFSDAFGASRSDFAGLDLAQKKRLAGYMKYLLEEKKFSQERVREMVSAFVEFTNGRYVASPVGYFCYLEPRLIRDTEPAQAKDYSWGAEAAPAKAVAWSW